MYIVTITDTTGQDHPFIIRADVEAHIALEHAVKAYERLLHSDVTEELEAIDWSQGVNIKRALVL